MEPPTQRAAQKRAQGLTLAEYAATWIEQRTVNGEPLRPRTKLQYERLLDQHITPTSLAQIPLSSITSDAVRAWHATTLPGSPAYRAQAYGLVRAVLATAVADGHIPFNPAQIRGASSVTTKREPVILEVAEVGQLADAITDDRYKALILISAWCGLRWSEVSALQRRDIGPDCAVITVRRGVSHRGAKCIEDTPKSGKIRKVITPPHIRPAIKHHLVTHAAKESDALVFPADRSCHLIAKTFARHYIKALDAIGRDGKKKPRPTVHDLRHFAGTQTARVGNLVETMGRLGHSTVKASLVYQGVVSGRDAEIATALSELAAPKTPEQPALSV